MLSVIAAQNRNSPTQVVQKCKMNRGSSMQGSSMQNGLIIIIIIIIIYLFIYLFIYLLRRSSKTAPEHKKH